MYIIGIDPGKNGGIAALSGTAIPRIVDISPMPGSISKIWEHFIYLGFPNLINKENTYVFIESVHSRPTDGVVSAFSFGHHIGVLDTILDRLCSRKNTRLVRPVEWMEYFSLQRSKEETQYNFKKRILEYANKRISEKRRSKDKRSLGKLSELTLKTCDAYLIARYGYKTIFTRSPK